MCAAKGLFALIMLLLMLFLMMMDLRIAAAAP